MCCKRLGLVTAQGPWNRQRTAVSQSFGSVQCRPAEGRSGPTRANQFKSLADCQGMRSMSLCVGSNPLSKMSTAGLEGPLPPRTLPGQFKSPIERHQRRHGPLHSPSRYCTVEPCPAFAPLPLSVWFIHRPVCLAVWPAVCPPASVVWSRCC